MNTYSFNLECPYCGHTWSLFVAGVRGGLFPGTSCPNCSCSVTFTRVEKGGGISVGYHK